MLMPSARPSDLALLDKESAGAVRATLRTMLTDSERRQALIQELVKSNNQLKSVKCCVVDAGVNTLIRVFE